MGANISIRMLYMFRHVRSCAGASMKSIQAAFSLKSYRADNVKCIPLKANVIMLSAFVISVDNAK